MPDRLSVCICTFNRSASLAVTLASLTRQTYAKTGDYELLIIDNGCTDDTQRVVESYASRLPLKRIFEDKQGQCYARNRAIAEFSGDVLLFTDDDVTLDENWLTAYASALEKYPKADLFGGRSIAAFQEKKPKWLVDCNMSLLSGVIVNFDYGEDVKLLSPADPGPWGVSLGIRRRLLEKLGGFRTDLDPIGLSRGRGGDTEFVDRALRIGAERVYVGDALCWHRVDPSRLTLRSLYRHGVEKGRAHAITDNSVPKKTLMEAFLFVIRGLGQAAKGRGDRARQCIINAGMVMGLRRSSRIEGRTR